MFSLILDKIIDAIVAGGKSERQACYMVMLLLKTVLSEDEIESLINEYEGIRFS